MATPLRWAEQIFDQNAARRSVNTMDSDEILAAGVQQGNQAHLQKLLERYYQPLLRFSFWLCGGSQAQAEDIVQETFVRMMRGIAGYDPGRPFKPWLYAIAEHIAYNQELRARAHPAVDLTEDLAYPDHLPLPEEQVESGETRQRVLEELSRLPIRQRESIILFYYENLSQNEIAALLGIPVGTVKSRLSLGLKQLRAQVERKT